MPKWTILNQQGPGPIGSGLAIVSGVLVADISSGLEFSEGAISVKNGSGIAINGSGQVTVQAGVGLTVSGGYLEVATGTGLGIDGGGNVYVPGGAITQSLLAALAVGTAQIQAGAVGTAQIAAAAITTALIANAAITNALLGTAVVGTANIQNGAITTALIANAAIGTAQISSLNASVITAGTLSVGSSLNANGITTNITNSSVGGAPAGLVVSSNSNFSQSVVQTGLILLYDSAGGIDITLSAQASGGSFISVSHGGGLSNETVISPTGITIGASIVLSSSTFAIGPGSLSGTHAQNIGTADSPTFTGLTISGAASLGSLAVSGTISGAFSGSFSGSHMQNVGTGDSPSFAALTTTGNVNAYAVVATGYVEASGGFIVPGYAVITAAAVVQCTGLVFNGTTVTLQTVGGVANVLVA